MKPITTVLERQGDLGGEKIAMQIDADATAHIMSVLTDLYSDTVLAVVREYSTNALDAHKAVGQTRPIEVTTPTAMAPFFKVKDFGLGLDVDDIRNIYSKYGASTKRDSNDFNGVLGLGCKSALTYTNQFTVTSVKDAVKTTVSVSRSENGAGHMEVVSIVPTTESNFTEVTVPTRDGKFLIRATKFFSYWTPGTVLLNGVDPAGLPKDARKVTPRTYMVPGGEEDIVVMGNVAYPVETALYADNRGYGRPEFTVVAYVEMGEVAFVPSREKLMMTPRTTEALTRIRREFKDALFAEMRKDIEDAPTHFEAYKRHKVWAKSFRSTTVPDTYKGKKIPQNFEPVKDVRPPKPVQPGSYYTPKPTMTFYDTRRGRYSVSEGQTSVPVDFLEKSILVTEYDGMKLTPGHKEKMNFYAQGKSLTPENFVLTADKEMGKPWVEVHSVTWADVKAIKLPRQAVQRAARIAPYDVIQPDGRIVQEANITNPTILYVSPSEEVLQDGRYGRGNNVTHQSRKALTAGFPGATIVVLAMNRWDKFKRDYPHALRISEHVRAELATASAALTLADRQWMGIDSYERDTLGELNPHKIDDPEIVALITMAKLTEPPNVTKYNATVAMCRRARIAFNEVSAEKSPMGNYPLVDRDAMRRHREHVYLYMNAVYAQTV